MAIARGEKIGGDDGGGDDEGEEKEDGDEAGFQGMAEGFGRGRCGHGGSGSGVGPGVIFDDGGFVGDTDEEFVVSGGEFDVAAGHCDGGDLFNFFKVGAGHSFVGKPRERGDEARGTRGDDVGCESDDGAGGEVSADAELGVIGDDGTEELFAGGFFDAVEGHSDLAVGIFEIAGGSSGTEVGPFADDGLTEESDVLFAGVSEEERVGDFAADAGAGSEGGVFADVGTGADDAVGTDGDGAGDDGVGADFGVWADDDGAVLGVEDGPGPDFDAGGEVDVVRVKEVDAGVEGGVVGGAEGCEVFIDGGMLMVEEVPRAIDHGGGCGASMNFWEERFECARVVERGKIDRGGEVRAEVHPEDGGVGDVDGIGGRF